MSDNSGQAVYGAITNVHKHECGRDVLDAATRRARNTTIAIGADQDNGALLLDIDVQGEVCADVDELREQLHLVIDALNGADLSLPVPAVEDIPGRPALFVRLSAFAAECVEHGDMTPAAARMLNRILDGE